MTGSDTPMADGTAWKVTSVSRAGGKDANGAPVQGVQVGFMLGTGQQGTVFIPMDQPTTEQVTAAVGPAATNLAAILNLTSG